MAGITITTETVKEAAATMAVMSLMSHRFVSAVCPKGLYLLFFYGMSLEDFKRHVIERLCVGRL